MKLLLAFLGLTFMLLAQPASQQPVPPDCVRFFAFTADGAGTQSSGALDNRSVGCTSWVVWYQATGAGAITNLEFQAAPGASVVGAFVAYPGTVDTGINPNTSSTGAVSYFHNAAVVTPWVRVLLTEGTYVGPLNGVFYGWRNRGQDSGAGPGGGGAGCPDPCTVIGPDAPGAAPTEAPVQVSGIDPSGNVERLTLDAGGRTPPSLASVAGADGISNTIPTPTTEAGVQLYYRMFPYLFNGSTNDREFSCPNTAVVSVAATGPTQIIALSGVTTIRICNFNGTVDAGGALDLTIVRGTGANCAVGTTTIAGPYDQITALDLFSRGAPLTVAAGSAVCLTNSAATAFTGVVMYAQF